MKTPIRIAISGAAGRIAYNLIFRTSAGTMFGDDQSIVLSLLDEPKKMNVLRGLELELRDCDFPLLHDIAISDDPDTAFAGADWIIMLAARPVGPYVFNRLDLLRDNGPIHVLHGQAIERTAKTARVLVVAEPCNANCLIAMKQAHSVPPEHWFALNRKDQMRAKSQIALKANVPVSLVNRVIVWGNRSRLTYVDFANSFIGEQPASTVISDLEWARKNLQDLVTQRDRQVHDLRGDIPAATATQAILGTIRTITNPTPFGRNFGASVLSDGSYGIPKRIVFGFPLRTEDGAKWSIVPDMYLDEFAQQRIQENVDELEVEAAVAGL